MFLVFFHGYVSTEDIRESEIRGGSPDNFRILEFYYDYLIPEKPIW